MTSIAPYTQTVPLDDTPEAQAEAEYQLSAGLEAMYGSDFPLIPGNTDAKQEAAWVNWARKYWLDREAAMTYALWIAQRNREFWAGRQWIDSEGIGRRWITPRAPSDAVRMVVNVTKAALDLRAQIVSEQRPGYKIEPTNRDTQSKKKAEAKQLALNYAWSECNMEAIHTELARWAGTDGVAFTETYWDTTAGPWHEMMSGQSITLGDVRKRVLRIDEVRVSPDATATVPPKVVIVRRIVPTQEAVARWGISVAGQNTEEGTFKGRGNQGLVSYNDAGRQDDRYFDTPTLEEYAVYCDKGDYLKNGLELHVVGEKVTYLGKLLFGRIPVARYTDGSKDAAYFPEPLMNNWVDDQVSINMVVSKMVETIRKSAGGAFMARPQTITSETKMFGGLSLIEVQGTASLDDLVKYIPPATVGRDAIELLTFQLQQFEQKSGWNDATRGSFKSDTSGRAILAIREQVERTFQPLVGAFCRGAIEDAKNTLAAMAWGYELPREVAITGKSRMDLARLITAEELDGVSDVTIAPESLMPMPRSLRLSLLNQYYTAGLLPADKFLRMQPFAWLEDLGDGDEDDRARANRIADLIRRGVSGPQLPPALPMGIDNPLIHMDVLRRELLLDDDLPNEVKAVAFDRYMVYQNFQMQAMLAQQASMPTPSQQQPGKSKEPPGASQFPADQAPLASQRPPIAAQPLGLDMSEEMSAGQAGDQMLSF